MTWLDIAVTGSTLLARSLRATSPLTSTFLDRDLLSLERDYYHRHGLYSSLTHLRKNRITRSSITQAIIASTAPNAPPTAGPVTLLGIASAKSRTASLDVHLCIYEITCFSSSEVCPDPEGLSL